MAILEWIAIIAHNSYCKAIISRMQGRGLMLCVGILLEMLLKNKNNQNDYLIMCTANLFQKIPMQSVKALLNSSKMHIHQWWLVIDC